MNEKDVRIRDKGRREGSSMQLRILLVSDLIWEICCESRDDARIPLDVTYQDNRDYIVRTDEMNSGVVIVVGKGGLGE